MHLRKRNEWRYEEKGRPGGEKYEALSFYETT